MEQEKSSSSPRGGQEVAPEAGSAKGKLVNGAFFSDEELDEFSRQDFLEPFEKMERDSMPRVNAVRFIQRYLPIMMDPRAEKDDTATWINMWGVEISPNLRLSVMLTGENGEPEYILPPPTGTIYTGNTGHVDSIEGRMAFLAIESRRLQSAGKFIKARIYNDIPIATEANSAHANDLLRLLADAGYLIAISPELHEQHRSKEGTSVTRYLTGATGGKPLVEPVASGMVVPPVVDMTHTLPGNKIVQSDAGEMDYD